MAVPAPATPTPRPELHDVLPADCVELHALGFELHADAEGRTMPPEWVHLVPAGELDKESGELVVRGRDGRSFTIDDPKLVLAGTELPMQFDWEHLSMFGVWGGGERSSRAAGWIDRLEWLEKAEGKRTMPGLWGHVARWTPDGQSDVEQGYYRGLSPVVRYQRREPELEGNEPPPPLLRGLVNVALTNRPNLRMALLHNQEHAALPRETETKTMNEELQKLARRLGLAANATEAEIARAAFAQLDTLVPKADLEQALNRAQAAETEVKRIRDEQHTAAAKRAIEDARKAGKIAPASVPYYERNCASPEGLKAFVEFVASLPNQVADDPHTTVSPPGSDGGKTPLTAEQKSLATSMGLTEDAYRAAL